MPAPRVLVCLLILYALALTGCSISAHSAAADRPRVRIGAASFAEQTVLAELYAQALEANGYRIERRLNLGTREVVEPALGSGQIDLVPEYLASLLAYLSGGTLSGSADPAETAAALEPLLRQRDLRALTPAPASNNNGFAVTRATAETYGLATLSDLAAVGPQLTLGAGPECPKRVFCLVGLETVYGVRFKAVRALDSGGPLTVAALESGQVDVAALYTTDAVIAARGLVMLADDRRLQRAENVVPVVRNDLLTRAPGDFRSILDDVSTRLTTGELVELNRRVVVERADPERVAGDWLREHGLTR